ncbi:hypothetical protein ACFWWC_46610 [Streptomyces sp. NPDC058642]|uniref:hypothetical protein n=1 Tax=Streptomyces sp. NPDC058642 TaxID=3346572 RepID=UPI00364B234F
MEGIARYGNKLWGLTPLGLDAAAEVLARPVSEMGRHRAWRGSFRAPHAMAVNETIIAISRTARREADEPHSAHGASQP